MYAITYLSEMLNRLTSWLGCQCKTSLLNLFTLFHRRIRSAYLYYTVVSGVV